MCVCECVCVRESLRKHPRVYCLCVCAEPQKGCGVLWTIGVIGFCYAGPQKAQLGVLTRDVGNLFAGRGSDQIFPSFV